MNFDYEKIKRLVSIVEQNQLTELEVEENGVSITIKAEVASTVMQIPSPIAQAAPHTEVQASVVPAEHTPHVEPPATEAPTGNLFEIKSPMIGIFYRTPSPDSPPYIEIGEDIEVGQTIGLIEAMKVFSEIPSEVAGKVVALPVENAKLVQQGDVLVVVELKDAEV